MERARPLLMYGLRNSNCNATLVHVMVVQSLSSEGLVSGIILNPLSIDFGSLTSSNECLIGSTKHLRLGGLKPEPQHP